MGETDHWPHLATSKTAGGVLTLTRNPDRITPGGVLLFFYLGLILSPAGGIQFAVYSKLPLGCCLKEGLLRSEIRPGSFCLHGFGVILLVASPAGSSLNPTVWGFSWRLDHVGMIGHRLCFQPFSPCWRMAGGADGPKLLLMAWCFW